MRLAPPAPGGERQARAPSPAVAGGTPTSPLTPPPPPLAQQQGSLQGSSSVRSAVAPLQGEGDDDLEQLLQELGDSGGAGAGRGAPPGGRAGGLPAVRVPLSGPRPLGEGREDDEGEGEGAASQQVPGQVPGRPMVSPPAPPAREPRSGVTSPRPERVRAPAHGPGLSTVWGHFTPNLVPTVSLGPDKFPVPPPDPVHRPWKQGRTQWNGALT